MLRKKYTKHNLKCRSAQNFNVLVSHHGLWRLESQTIFLHSVIVSGSVGMFPSQITTHAMSHKTSIGEMEMMGLKEGEEEKET